MSFYAPQGLSGSPLISGIQGEPQCYGYMIEQSTIGLSDAAPTPVGLAVSIEVLLGIKSRKLGVDLATLLGREYVPPRPPMSKQLPGGMKPTDTGLEEWPED